MKPTNADRVNGHLRTLRITREEIAKLSGQSSSHTRNVLTGRRTNEAVRQATIAIVEFADPKIADTIETLWPKGEKLAA